SVRDGRRSVAQRRRIDVIEARSTVPQRLPQRMRPVLFQKTRVGDERALDRRPLIQVFRLEQRPDQNRRQQKNQQEIEEEGSPSRAAFVLHRLAGAGPGDGAIYRRPRLWNCLCRRKPERCARYFARTHRIDNPYTRLCPKDAEEACAKYRVGTGTSAMRILISTICAIISWSKIKASEFISILTHSSTSLRNARYPV